VDAALRLLFLGGRWVDAVLDSLVPENFVAGKV